MPLIPGAYTDTGYGGGGPDAAGPDQPGPPAGDPSEIYRQIIDLVREAIAEEKDEQDRLILEQVTTMVQKILANDQKTLDQTLGNSGLASILRRL